MRRDDINICNGPYICRDYLRVPVQTHTDKRFRNRKNKEIINKIICCTRRCNRKRRIGVGGH